MHAEDSSPDLCERDSPDVNPLMPVRPLGRVLKWASCRSGDGRCNRCVAFSVALMRPRARLRLVDGACSQAIPHAPVQRPVHT